MAIKYWALLLAAALSPQLYAEPGCINGKTVIGCQRDATLDKIAALGREDVEAVNRLLALAMLSGECEMFTDGEKVFIEDRQIFAERRQIRRPGELKTYWMPSSWTETKGCTAPIPTPKANTEPAHTPEINSPQKITLAPSTFQHTVSPPKPTCEYKQVMTDEEIAACRSDAKQ